MRGVIDGPGEVPVEAQQGRRTRLPFVIYVLALGTFLMITTEFLVAVDHRLRGRCRLLGVAGGAFPDGAGRRGVHHKSPQSKNKQWR